MDIMDMDIVDMGKQGLEPKGSSVDIILSFFYCLLYLLQYKMNSLANLMAPDSY